MRNATAAADTIRLGDKGDGTPASHAEAKQRHAHINNGHIPDMYRLGSPHDVYEFKCYTPFRGTRGAVAPSAMASSDVAEPHRPRMAPPSPSVTLRRRYVPAYTASPHEAPRMIPPLTDARAWGMSQNDAAPTRRFGEEVQRPLAEHREHGRPRVRPDYHAACPC